MLNHTQNNKAFTLIETLLSVAMMAVLAGFFGGFYYSFLVRNDTVIASYTVVNSLRRAQLLSQSMESDSAWGVKMQDQSIVLFQGQNYAGRETSFDEIFDVPSNISFSGETEIVFSRLEGLPNVYGDIDINSDNNDNITLIINEKGNIDY